MAFIFITEYLEPAGLAYKLLGEGEEVFACILNKDSRNVCKNIVPQIDDWHETLGKGNVYIVDGCEHGKLSEWLRSQEELVVGGSEASDEFENDRQAGLDIFKKYKVQYPKARYFTNFEDAIKAIKDHPAPYVFKQMGDAAKGFSYVGKFEDGTDMIDRIEHYKKVWHENTDGPIYFLLQERVYGYEVAVGAYFNGKDWMRDGEGHVVVECNFEGKKLLPGDIGPTTGETTTMMFPTNEENILFEETLGKLEPYLKELKYVGDMDINCIVTKEGDIYALEPTARFGFPALDMQVGCQITPWGEFLRAMAEGKQVKGGLKYKEGWTCVMVVYAPPFPFQTHKAENQAEGQRIYWLRGGEWEGKDVMPKNIQEHFHPYEVLCDEEGIYRLAGESGYVMTITANGRDHNEAADACIDRIKDTILFSEMGYRIDSGSRLDDPIKELTKMGFIEPMCGEPYEDSH